MELILRGKKNPSSAYMKSLGKWKCKYLDSNKFLPKKLSMEKTLSDEVCLIFTECIPSPKVTISVGVMFHLRLLFVMCNYFTASFTARPVKIKEQ